MKKITPIIMKNILLKDNDSTNSLLIKKTPPLSVYIHVPWCLKKCPYCDFNSHQISGTSNIPEEEYLKGLKIELEQSLPLIWDRKIISVYIGGGTPSLLKAESIDKIIEMLRTLLKLGPHAEITIEINPGTSSYNKIKEYISSGINRISIGAQSFDNNKLKRLGRIHDKYDSVRTIQVAQSLIDNINVDIMFGLPGQTLKDCLEDLKEPLLSEINHISMYNLTIEKNTFFAKNTPSDLPNDDENAEMQDCIENELFKRNIIRYEVSAYSKKYFKSVHNSNYWTFGDYLGIGPGSHSKISFQQNIVRKKRIYNPYLWLKKTLALEDNIDDTKILKYQEIPFEFMLNALRLKNGVKRSLFNERTGLPISIISKKLEEAYSKKLLEEDPIYFRATKLGWKFLNNLQEIFL